MGGLVAVGGVSERVSACGAPARRAPGTFALGRCRRARIVARSVWGVTVVTDGDRFMRETDAFSWYMEKDPALRSTILAVAWLERSPDFEVLASRLERATRLIPRFRQRPVDPPGRLATPRWTDTHFDLSLHLRRVNAPTPATDATVVELARLEAMSGFDRARPLWQFTLVEQLIGGVPH